MTSIVGFIFGYLLIYLVVSFIDEYNNNVITNKVGNYKYLIIFLMTIFMPYTVVFMFAWLIWYVYKTSSIK